MPDTTQDEYAYQPKFGGGGEIYLKLNDWSEREESVKLRIVSPTHTRLEFRENDELVDTKGWDVSRIQEAIEDPELKKSQRFSWVVLVRNDDGSSTAKVWEAGSGVFKKISAIAQDPEWRPITECDLKVVRKGMKKDARYDIMPSPNNRGQLSDEEYDIADEVQLTKYIPQAMPLSKFIETYGG